ncbi:hypothetical protein Gotur_005422 [Gossypium turneri]
MANLDSAMDSAFWDQTISTPQILEGSAKSVPGEPFPLDGARASKTLRIQQLSLLRNGFPLGIIPSLSPPSAKTWDPSLFRLSCSDPPLLTGISTIPLSLSWTFLLFENVETLLNRELWLGLIGQFRPKKLISAIKTELQSADELELSVFRDAANHFLDKSLYSIALAAQLSLPPS